jgi:hypothetical protein
VDFEQVLKEVVWRLVTEGRISYRRIKLSFALDDDGLEELRRELIVLKRVAADVEGELLVWAPDGRAARPEPMALPRPLLAMRQAERSAAPAAVAAASARNSTFDRIGIVLRRSTTLCTCPRALRRAPRSMASFI